MTMQNKIGLLLVVLVAIVLRSTALELYTGKGSSALNRKEYAKDNDDADDRSNHHERMDDEYSAPLTSRRHRYPGHGSSTNNHRSRSRWPQSRDDYSSDSNDWAQSDDFGLNDLLASLPGFSSPAAFDNGPICHSILDPQYTLFSDVCGVVPQARYSLPNYFGHVDRWQIAQALTMLLGPSAQSAGNPSCARSLRLLICPLLFPPCQSRREIPPVLPCQPFCQAVKNQCPGPALDLVPCDFLPFSSDLCPMNPSPYSSLFSPFGSPLSMNGGLSSAGFPPSGLASLLAQSALSSGFSQSPFSASDFSPFSTSRLSQSGFPSSGFSPFSSSDFSPSRFVQSGFPQPAYPSSFSPPGFPQPAYPSPFSPPGFSPSLFPSSGYSPSLSGYPQAAFSPATLPGPTAPKSATNQFNSAQYSTESLTPILVDFPPITPANDARPAGRSFPALRSKSATA